MFYGTYNYSYWGESKPTNITGGGHIVGEIIPKFLHITRIPLWFSVGNPVAMDQPTGSSTDFPDKLVPPYLATFFMKHRFSVGFMPDIPSGKHTKKLWKITFSWENSL